MDNNNFNNDPNYGASNNDDYSAPQQDYSAPQQDYSAPQQDYSAPQQDYSAPQQDYSAPQQTYGQYTNSDAQNNSYNYYQNNEQQYNGQQYGEQQYNSQQYGTQQYNGQQYNSYNNGQYTNTYGTYGNLGGVPVDGKGQPLKNRFGMKLTFSILEIISCNLISLIMGILGCVFTSKANTAYKEGRWEDFKSAAKTATIVLWVGLGGIILSVIMSVVTLVAVFQELEPYQDEISTIIENDGNIDYDDLYDQMMQDPEFSDLMNEIEENYNDGSYGDSYSNEGNADSFDVSGSASMGEWYTFSINGQIYSVPNYPETFVQSGLTWEDCYYTDKIATDDYELYYWDDPVTDEHIGLVWIANVGEEPCSPADGIAFEVNIENSSVYGGYKPDLVFGDGLTFDSSLEEIIAYFGEPDDEYHYSDSSSSSDTYYWYMDDDYCGIEVDFYDGQFYELYIEYYGD